MGDYWTTGIISGVLHGGAGGVQGSLQFGSGTRVPAWVYVAAGVLLARLLTR